jgi:predicted nucleic acid-binding protein
VILADTSALVANAAVGDDQALAVSVISLGELEVGVRVAQGEQVRAQRASRLAGIIDNASILLIDPQVAAAYATLRARVGRQPTNDLWIAATAIANGLELLTGDEQQARLPGIRARYISL